MSDPTVAYVRPTRPDWRHRGENLIEKVRDAYDAIWDLMPAIGAFAMLIWLLNVIPQR